MLCVDVARAFSARVRLVNATEAACTAYAHTLDIEEFKVALLLFVWVRIFTQQLGKSYELGQKATCQGGVISIL